MRTQITDLLDTHGIPYRLLPHSEAVYTVEAAAAQRGVVAEEMVKSILLREKSGERRYVMACVLGHERLDPKAVRTVLGDEQWRRLTFALATEISAVTGYIKGAVAPLCLPEELPVIFDVAIADCHKVNISSGDPMSGLELDPQALIMLANAITADIAN